jgi:hypothetical protein
VKDIKVKQEPHDTDTETKKKQARTKKRTTKASDTTAPAPKKRKLSPPSARTRTRRRSPPKTKKTPIITPRSSISSNESNYSELNKLKAELDRSSPSAHLPVNTTMTMLPYLDLLCPYMAFQLSLSGLSGKAYETAQASMTEVIDVVDRLKGTTGHYDFGREVHADERKTAANRRDGNGVVLVNKRKEEESIVTRKLRELEDHVGVDSVCVHNITATYC